jgi:hypothetical protein
VEELLLSATDVRHTTERLVTGPNPVEIKIAIAR